MTKATPLHLEELAVRIEKERGPLNFLALFQREGSLDWELVFAAPWAQESLRDAIVYISTKAVEVLTKDEQAEIKLVVRLRTAVSELAEMFPAPGKYDNFTLFEARVQHAIIARLRPDVLVTA